MVNERALVLKLYCAATACTLGSARIRAYSILSDHAAKGSSVALSSSHGRQRRPEEKENSLYVQASSSLMPSLPWLRIADETLLNFFYQVSVSSVTSPWPLSAPCAAQCNRMPGRPGAAMGGREGPLTRFKFFFPFSFSFWPPVCL